MSLHDKMNLTNRTRRKTMSEERRVETLQIRLTSTMKEEFQQAVKRKGENQTDLVRKWIEDYIKTNKN